MAIPNLLANQMLIERSDLNSNFRNRWGKSKYRIVRSLIKWKLPKNNELNTLDL